MVYSVYIIFLVVIVFSLQSAFYVCCQAENVSICSIGDDLKEKLKKFRFRKATNNAAIISKKLFFTISLFIFYFVDCYFISRRYQLAAVYLRLSVSVCPSDNTFGCMPSHRQCEGGDCLASRHVQCVSKKHPRHF